MRVMRTIGTRFSGHEGGGTWSLQVARIHLSDGRGHACVAGRVATVVNNWMRRGHTAYHAWLVEMLQRSTTRFGTPTSISANALG